MSRQRNQTAGVRDSPNVRQYHEGTQAQVPWPEYRITDSETEVKRSEASERVLENIGAPREERN
jgi:hypothetical protein